VSLRTRFKIEDPAKIEGTITITMTMAEWEALRDQISPTASAKSASGEYLARQMSFCINDLLADVRKIFWSEPPEGEDT
jgi:hypothetical protein